MKQINSLLSLLNERVQVSKKFTKDKYIANIKRDLELYDPDYIKIGHTINPDLGANILYDLFSKRFKFQDRLIFNNVENAKASIFDRAPDLIIKAKTSTAEEKREVLKGIYDYLIDKLDIKSFADEALFWFVLTGFVSAIVDYKIDVKEEEIEGEKYTILKYDDPIISVVNPLKTYYSPLSEFDIDGDKVPYVIMEKNMPVDEIEEIYKREVEADAKLSEAETLDYDEIQDPTIDLATVYYYFGGIPKKFKSELRKYGVSAGYNKIYFIAFTENTILTVVERPRKGFKFARLFTKYTNFFGFGFGKIGEPYQILRSQRRAQISRNADLHAYPKLAMKNDGTQKIDPETYKDTRSNLVITYTSEPPQYLAPPPIAQSVLEDLAQVDRESQAVFGLLDLATGKQQSIVKTATGQTLFAEASQKRMKQAKRQFMQFFRACIIELFKQCRDNWNSPKQITITNEDGITKTIEVSAEDLQDINFDEEIDIDFETASINKDVIRQQHITLYEKTKDDPLVNRKALFIDMLRKGFNVVNPERYIKEEAESPEQEAMEQQQMQGAPSSMPQMKPTQNVRPESHSTHPNKIMTPVNVKQVNDINTANPFSNAFGQGQRL